MNMEIRLLEGKANNMSTMEINLGSSGSVIKAKLGEPKKISTYNGYDLFWYGSTAPLKADIFYLQNDQLVLKTHPAEEQAILSFYLSKYGIPEKSVSYYNGKFLEKDSFETTLHLWPSAGVDVASYGVGPSSKVFLIRTYSPTNLEKYFQELGQEFAGNNVVAFKPNQQSTENLKKIEKLEVVSELTSSQSSALFWKLGMGNLLAFWVTVGVLASLLLGCIAFFFFRRFKRNRRASDQSFPTTPPTNQSPLIQ